MCLVFFLLYVFLCTLMHTYAFITIISVALSLLLSIYLYMLPFSFSLYALSLCLPRLIDLSSTVFLYLHFVFLSVLALSCFFSPYHVVPTYLCLYISWFLYPPCSRSLTICFSLFLSVSLSLSLFLSCCLSLYLCIVLIC